MFPYSTSFLIIMISSPALLFQKSSIHTSYRPDSQSTLSNRLTYLIPRNQSHSLLFLSASPQKIPLNFINSICKFHWNSKKTQSISRDTLKTSFKKSNFTCLAQKIAFPSCQLLIKFVYKLFPERVRNFWTQRKTQIGRGERFY